MGVLFVFLLLCAHPYTWGQGTGESPSSEKGDDAVESSSSSSGGKDASDQSDVQDVVPGGPEPPKAEAPEETPLKPGEIVPEAGKSVEEKLELPERKAEREKPQMPEMEYPSELIDDVEDPEEELDVSLNFDAAPLTEVVPLFAELLGFSYNIDPGVKGAVTMTVDSKMSARESWRMFEHILWLAGAYASRNPGFIQILPFEKMSRERQLLVDHDPQANVEVALLPVYHTQSQKIISKIKPFMTKGATVTDIARLNKLLIVESPMNMPKIRKLVQKLDSQGESRWPYVVIRARNIKAEDMVQQLKMVLPVLGYPVSGGKGPSGGKIKLTAVPAVEVVVASAALPKVLDEVKRWADLLDKEERGKQQRIFFYNVRHSTAEHLSEALGTFFNTATTEHQVRRETEKSTSGKAKAKGQATPPSPSGGGQEAQEAGTSESIFDTPVQIYADSEQNRLTIRTTNRAYSMVEAVLKRLDLPKRQVAITGYVAEVRLTDSLKFGFGYAAQQKFNDYVISHGMNHAPSTPGFGDGNQTGQSAFSIGNGISLLLQKNINKRAFLTAVAGKSNVRILSAPQIVASSDEEATINVGAEVPVVTSTERDDTDNLNNINTDIEYRDTGVMLTVTPHITAGNQVTLDIEQEVSSIAEQQEGATIAQESSPTISKKNLKSTLVAPDGGTVLMGGLIENQTTKGHTGVPILKGIPLLGKLFRTNETSSTRNELVVLVSVNVIENQQTTNILAQRYQNALNEIRTQMGDDTKEAKTQER